MGRKKVRVLSHARKVLHYTLPFSVSSKEPTAASLREPRMRLHKQIDDAVTTAGKLCDCSNCAAERARKQSDMITPCELNKRMREIHDSIIPPMPSNFHPELSPNYFDNKSPRISRKAF